MKKVIETPFKHYPLEDTASLDPLMEAIGDSRFVLLGEASHGTSDYYTWRTAISKRLIQEKGFNFIAVEGDPLLRVALGAALAANLVYKNLPAAARNAVKPRVA